MLEFIACLGICAGSVALVCIVAFQHFVLLRHGIRGYWLLPLYLGAMVLALLKIYNLFRPDIAWISVWVRPIEVFGAAMICALVFDKRRRGLHSKNEGSVVR